MNKNKIKKKEQKQATIEHHSTNTLDFKIECGKVSKKVFLVGTKFQAKIPSHSRVFVEGEQQKHILHLRTKD